ncbi:MAG: mucoidy inhibitor MuiA family protein [Candidatus Aminicenantales bacterium]
MKQGTCDIHRKQVRTAGFVAAFFFAAGVGFAQEAGSPASRDAASEIAARSAVTTVTVFPDRATVTREADLDLSTSVKAVVFKGLPASVIGGSLRVSGRGTAAVKLLSIDVRDEFLESPLLPELNKLQAELEAIEFEIQQTGDALAVIDAQTKFLASIQASSADRASREIAEGRTDIAAWDRVVDFLGTRLGTLKKARLERLRVQQNQTAKAEALRKKIESLRPRQPLRGETAVANVEVSKAGSFRMSLSYTVRNADWAPRYTLRALPDSSEIELGMTADIVQRSGENWDKARVILSTSTPALGAGPSELLPWLIDLYVPPPPSPRSDRRMMATVMAEKAAVPEEAPELEAELDTAALDAAGLHVRFEIRREVDVPSDGAPHRFPIDARTLKAAYDYLAVPKLVESVFLRGTLTNSLEYPLLAGNADLFIGQDFVGSTRLETVATGEEAKLFFGADPQIKIERLQTKREKSAPGFLGKNDRTKLSFTIAVQNFRKTAAAIDVVDQIPVSQNTRIEVKDVSLRPAPSSKDDQGLLTWKINLAPQEKKEILIDFTVEYPKGATLTNF